MRYDGWEKGEESKRERRDEYVWERERRMFGVIAMDAFK